MISVQCGRMGLFKFLNKEWKFRIGGRNKERKKEGSRRQCSYVAWKCWNIYVERNRRVFEARQMDPAQVIQEIKVEMMVRKMACRNPEVTWLSMLSRSFEYYELINLSSFTMRVLLCKNSLAYTS